MAMDSIETYSGPSTARSRSLEYRLYFTLIFCLAAPIALVRWCLALVTGNRSELRKGIIRRAISEAKTTTPFIFSV